MRKIIYWIIPSLFLFCCGCDSNVLEPIADDSSHAADLEEARMALDDGNYDKSIHLLKKYDNGKQTDPETARVLSSAYMGKAGVDLTYIIEFSGAGDKEGYDVIASALAHKATSNIMPRNLTAAASMISKELQVDDPLFIDQNDIAALLTAMNTAKTILQNLSEYLTENNLTPENDDIVKLGVASALDFIMKISETVTEITGTNAPINKVAYVQVFSTADRYLLVNDLETYLSLHPEIMGLLIDDLIHVKNAITVMIDLIGADEDITQDFDQFLRDILGLDNFTPVTDAVIREYLTAARIIEFVRTELID